MQLKTLWNLDNLLDNLQPLNHSEAKVHPLNFYHWEVYLPDFCPNVTWELRSTCGECYYNHVNHLLGLFPLSLTILVTNWPWAWAPLFVSAGLAVFPLSTSGRWIFFFVVISVPRRLSSASTPLQHTNLNNTKCPNAGKWRAPRCYWKNQLYLTVTHAKTK